MQAIEYIDSLHDVIIQSLVLKLKNDGKNAINNHFFNHYHREKRKPDIIVTSPKKEEHEVEVLEKKSLPKIEGINRNLVINISSDWENVLIITEDKVKNINEIKVQTLSLD